MKSSTGAHYLALDHVRALAALLVFTWHFIHGPVPFNYAPSIFPLALFDEGHVGVSLFMTLSGYLFAKLLDGKNVSYPRFLWNRLVRLLPLLFLVIGIAGIREVWRGASPSEYAWHIAEGIVLPTLPNGAWSITVEVHFYLVLPLLLVLIRRHHMLPVAIILAAILLRIYLWTAYGEVQTFAYGTIIGRIDQFVFGMLMFQFRAMFADRHILASAVFVAFSAFYYYFDVTGGFYNRPHFPSPSSLWILVPTIEAVSFASLIAWYDTSFAPPGTGLSAFIGKLGEYSYSIYLLHWFVVFKAASYVQTYVMDISNFYIALLWAVAGFAAMYPIGYLSFRFVEAPFLRYRVNYLIASGDLDLAKVPVAPRA